LGNSGFAENFPRISFSNQWVSGLVEIGHQLPDKYKIGHMLPDGGDPLRPKTAEKWPSDAGFAAIA
jgi:hypothetical protein